MRVRGVVSFVSLIAAVSCSSPTAPADRLPDCESVQAPGQSGACGLRAAGGTRFEARWSSMPGHPKKTDLSGQWHIHTEVKVFGRDGVKRQTLRQEGFKAPYFGLADLDGDGQDELLVTMVYGGADGNASTDVWRDEGKSYADVGQVSAAVRATGKNGIFVSQSHESAAESDLLFFKFQGGKIVRVATVPTPLKNQRCEAQVNLAGAGMDEEQAQEYFCAEAARLL